MERLCYPAWFEALGREAGLAYSDVFPNKVSGVVDLSRFLCSFNCVLTRLDPQQTGRPARRVHGAGLRGLGAGDGPRPRLPGGGRDHGQHRVSRTCVYVDIRINT